MPLGLDCKLSSKEITPQFSQTLTFIQRNTRDLSGEIWSVLELGLVSVGVGIGQCWSWEVLSLQLWRHISNKLLAWNDRAAYVPFSQSDFPYQFNCSTKRSLFAQPENTNQLPILTVFAMLCYQL